MASRGRGAPRKHSLTRAKFLDELRENPESTAREILERYGAPRNFPSRMAHRDPEFGETYRALMKSRGRDPKAYQKSKAVTDKEEEDRREQDELFFEEYEKDLSIHNASMVVREKWPERLGFSVSNIYARTNPNNSHYDRIFANRFNDIFVAKMSEIERNLVDAATTRTEKHPHGDIRVGMYLHTKYSKRYEDIRVREIELAAMKSRAERKNPTQPQVVIDVGSLASRMMEMEQRARRLNGAEIVIDGEEVREGAPALRDGRSEDDLDSGDPS